MAADWGGYDADWLSADLRTKCIMLLIPSTRGRKRKIRRDRQRYREGGILRPYFITYRTPPRRRRHGRSPLAAKAVPRHEDLQRIEDCRCYLGRHCERVGNVAASGSAVFDYPGHSA